MSVRDEIYDLLSDIAVDGIRTGPNTSRRLTRTEATTAILALPSVARAFALMEAVDTDSGGPNTTPNYSNSDRYGGRLSGYNEAVAKFRAIKAAQ